LARKSGEKKKKGGVDKKGRTRKEHLSASEQAGIESRQSRWTLGEGHYRPAAEELPGGARKIQGGTGTSRPSWGPILDRIHEERGFTG